MRFFPSADGYLYPVTVEPAPGEQPIAVAHLAHELVRDAHGHALIKPVIDPPSVYRFDGKAMALCEMPCRVPAADRAATPVWLCGGHPSIVQIAPQIRSSHRVMALNKTCLTLRKAGISPDWTVMLDAPEAYDRQSELTEERCMVARLNYIDQEFDGLKWRDWSNAVFIGDNAKEVGDWLRKGRLVWFKNSFMLAIQLLYRLGFREIRLAGCAFKDAGTYAYGQRPDLAAKNAELYAKQVAWLRANAQYFASCGLRIVNATPGSAADFLPTCS